MSMAAGGTTEVKRAAVVFNPTKVDLRRLRRVVESAELAAGWGRTAWYATSVEDAGQAATRRAIAAGAALVMAAGGDGTVRAVAEVLRNSGTPLALLPSGTGNLFARNLGLPIANLDEAVALAFGEAERAIDLGIIALTRASGETHEHVFLVVAGLGLDAQMIRNTPAELKRRVGWIAYFAGGFRSLATLKPVRIRYRLDGASARWMHVHTIMAGNCGSLPGGMVLMPDALPDDGILDFAVLRARGLFGWVRIVNKVTWENGVLRKSTLGRRLLRIFANDARSVTTFRGTSIDIEVESPQEIQLDGDEFGEARTVRVWVDPGALRVKAQPGSGTSPGARAEASAIS